MFSGKPIDYQDATLKNVGFWPDLNLKEFQVQRTIPPDVDAGTVAQALITAAGEVNSDLASVEAKHHANGYSHAAEVPGVSIDAENLLCAQYKKAVYARAKADLLGSLPRLVAGSHTQGRRVTRHARDCWRSHPLLSAV